MILIEHSCAANMNPIDLALRSIKEGCSILWEEQPSGSTIQFDSRRLCRDGLTLATKGVGVKDLYWSDEFPALFVAPEVIANPCDNPHG